MPSDNPFISLAQAENDLVIGGSDELLLAEKTPQQQAAAIRKAADQDKAPSAKDVTNTLPLSALDTVTSGFDVTRIPISRLRQMRRDPMIAFALFFIKAQLMRSRWMIQCSDAQVAAFIDNALREIYPSLVQQHMLKLDFGWSSMVKRFTKGNPDWTYFDPADEVAPERRVWDEGSIEAILWKPFVALPPESADPLFTTDGSFDGLTYSPTAAGGQGEKRDFDVLHCSPADELVLTANRGYVPIGELDDQQDRLVVWDKKQKRFCRTKGFAFQKGSRPYSGDLLTVAAGSSAARVTPNHKFTVRWTEEAQNKYSVYLMKKGDWWRMGITRVAREASKSSGLGIRLSAEGAEAAWVIGTFDSKNEALYHEKLWSNQYQIPDMVFQSSKWESASQTEHCLTTEQIEKIWGQLDSAPGARRLLTDRKLDEVYPFLRAGDINPRGTRGWTCNAVNMIDGLMEVPVDLGGDKAGWETVSIKHEDHDGEVFSIEVPPHHHYVSNGVVTQNSLWATNEKASVHESLWGYPRIGYAYRFWWSFWFNWGLADRHFEKDADPPAIVHYPSDKPAVNGRSMRQIALEIGNRARSNSTIALPSDAITGFDERPIQLRQWAVEFATGGGNFDAFKDRFDQLQLMMLQACMVPTDAFKAQGGTAGYNSTGQLQDAFASSQISLISDLDHDINRFIIPQLVAANFPEREVRVTKVTKGFDSVDIDLAKLLVTGVVNKDPESLNVDFAELAEAFGLPILSPTKIAKRQAEIAAQAAAVRPETIDPAAGNAGVTEDGLYVPARESIVVSLSDRREKDAEAVMLAELAQVAHLNDPIVFTDARGLREIWRTAISHDYAEAAQLVDEYRGNLDLDESFFERWTRRAEQRAVTTASRTVNALRSIMRRASTVEFDKAGYSDFSWDPLFSDEAQKWLRERGAELVKDISKTTREELKTYLADLVERDVDPAHMPQLVRSHFQMFSGWRADRLVRTEVAHAYNMGVLFAAEDAGIRQVQALDAQLGPDRSDQHCIDRNGRIFSIYDAIRETKDEHPNGTLQWRLLRKALQVSRAPIPTGAPTGVLAFADEENVVYFSDDLDEPRRNRYLIALVDQQLAA